MQPVSPRDPLRSLWARWRDDAGGTYQTWFLWDERLKNFHEEVDQELHAKIEQLLAELPTKTSDRNHAISEVLSQLNPILAALDPAIGAYLYKSYKSYAHRIATSSGGILSFFTISAEEKKWVDLPMLAAIVYNPEEEE